MTFAIAFALGMILAAAFTAYAVYFAPEGHQVPGIGFRYGPEPLDDAADGSPDGHRAGPCFTPFHDQTDSAGGAYDHG